MVSVNNTPVKFQASESIKRLSNEALPLADDFIDRYNDCESAFSERLDDIEESLLAMSNKLGDKIAEKFKTKSRYFAPDALVSKFNLHEALSSNIPYFQFRPASEIDVKKVKTIHTALRQMVSTYGLDMDCIMDIGNAIDTGIGVSELIVKEVWDSGWRVKEDTYVPGENEELERYKKLVSHAFKLRTYNVIDDEVRIAPNAPNFNPAAGADYIFLRDGFYTLDDIKKLAVDKSGLPGWYLKDDHNFNNLIYKVFDDFRASKIKNSQGVNIESVNAVPVHKVYYKDGTVDWILGKSLKIASRIPNNKYIGSMPIITSMLMPNPKNPYGMNLWEIMKHAVNMKSGVINLSADSGVKNVNASIVTDSIIFSKNNGSDLFSNKIIPIENDGRDVRSRMHQLQLVDMTPALNMLLNVSSADAQRLGRVPDLLQGFQQKQVRTSGVAEAMLAGNVSAKTMMVKLAEHTLYKPLGEHMLKALYNHYPKFAEDLPGIEREDLTMKFIRVKQGSSLEEDKSSHIETLASLKEEAKTMPFDFEITDIMRDLYKEVGLYEFDAYVADDQKKMMKILIANGLSQDMAAQVAQQALQVAQQQPGGAQ